MRTILKKLKNKINPSKKVEIAEDEISVQDWMNKNIELSIDEAAMQEALRSHVNQPECSIVDVLEKLIKSLVDFIPESKYNGLDGIFTLRLENEDLLSGEKHVKDFRSLHPRAYIVAEDNEKLLVKIIKAVMLESWELMKK